MRRFASFSATILISFSTVAQDVDIDLSLEDGISIDTQQWYENPVVWVGVVLIMGFILIITRRKRA